MSLSTPHGDYNALSFLLNFPDAIQDTRNSIDDSTRSFTRYWTTTPTHQHQPSPSLRRYPMDDNDHNYLSTLAAPSTIMSTPAVPITPPSANGQQRQLPVNANHQVRNKVDPSKSSVPDSRGNKVACVEPSRESVLTF